MTESERREKRFGCSYQNRDFITIEQETQENEGVGNRNLRIKPWNPDRDPGTKKDSQYCDDGKFDID